MNAWQRLLAASSLAIGTAWDLITHPRTGGSGVVVNNGATVALTDNTVLIALTDNSMGISIADAGFAVTVIDLPISTSIAPGITATITTQPIEGQA